MVTNVPGPQSPLYLLGARMQEIYPLVPLAGNQGLGIALFSYDGGLYWALLLLMHICVAALVIRWWISDVLARVVVVSVLFAVLDFVALSGALLGSAALFA